MGSSKDGNKEGTSRDDNKDGSKDGSNGECTCADTNGKDKGDDGSSKDGNKDGSSKDGNKDGSSKDGNKEGTSKDGNKDGSSKDGNKDGSSKDGNKDEPEEVSVCGKGKAAILRPNGECPSGSHSLVGTKADCQEAASELEYPDVVATGISKVNLVKGCYVRKNRLWFNTKGKSCTSKARKSICCATKGKGFTGIITGGGIGEADDAIGEAVDVIGSGSGAAYVVLSTAAATLAA